MTDEGSERPGGASGQEPPHHHDRPPGDERRNSWWPILLVIVGVLLLAGNFGMDLGGFWRGLGRIWSFWPIALIAVGADMLTRGKYRLLVISLAIGVAVVLAFSGGVGAAPAEPVSVNVPTGGATKSRVVLDLGVSPLDLTSGSGNSVLWGTVQLAGNERLDQKSVRRGDTLEVTLRSRGTGWLPFQFGSVRGGEWRLELNQDLPTDLMVDAGVGNLQLDLSDANLRGLALDAGVGGVTLTLPRTGSFDASVDGGVGGLTILVPRSLALTARIDTGIGSVRVGGGFEKRGNSYLSPAAVAGQPATVSLEIDAGVGSVSIRSVE